MQRTLRAAATRGRIGLARPALSPVAIAPRNFSSYGDNVTYSGGQAGVQGGFYGAGGARSQVSPQ